MFTDPDPGAASVSGTDDVHTFRRSHYPVILQAALDSGYRFVLFGEAPTAPYIYLRHDVDNSIDHALEMARQEKELGIAANYFFLLRSRNYNPFVARNVAAIRRIAEMGHGVGLHFSNEDEDVTAFSDNRLADRILEDARIFGLGLGIPLKSFSFHNPNGKDCYQISVDGLINAYSPAYFSEIKYLSESNFRWREGCPCTIFRDRRYDAIQLLIHPMTYASDLQSDRDAMIYFLHKKLRELKDHNEKENASLRDNPISMTQILDDIRSISHMD